MRSFDDDPRLEELLDEARQAQLLKLLESLTANKFALFPEWREHAEPVEFNLVTVGWLLGPNGDQQRAAARLLEFVLLFVGKYRLAANLHRSVTEENYLELARRHEALQESEAKLRALSVDLQRRVDEQVLHIEKVQRDLYESARLRSVGQLSAGVAHEINNPISFVLSNLRVAQDYLDDLDHALTGQSHRELLEDFRALIAESVGGANRISAIVRDLRTFSNIDQSEFVACDINSLLEAACRLVETECARGQRLHLRLSELPPWRGFPAKLSQAFYNVLDNAVRASPDSGLIEVVSEYADGVVIVSIRDHGQGMAEDVLSRAFDPFYTTRDVGDGTGLGLTVARDVAQAHGGEVLLQSGPGQGCLARLTLKQVEKG